MTKQIRVKKLSLGCGNKRVKGSKYEKIVVFFCVSQIENANDVLILPLERFRKEQISAAKVRRREHQRRG